MSQTNPTDSIKLYGAHNVMKIVFETHLPTLFLSRIDGITRIIWSPLERVTINEYFTRLWQIERCKLIFSHFFPTL